MIHVQTLDKFMAFCDRQNVNVHALREQFINQEAMRPTDYEEVLERLSLLAEQLFRIPSQLFLSKTRKRECVYIRKYIIRFIFDNFKVLTLADIGSLFTKFRDGEPYDHSSIIHACQDYEDLYLTTEDFREQANLFNSKAILIKDEIITIIKSRNEKITISKVAGAF